MEYVKKLSREARQKAQRLCVVQNFWNGLGVSFVVGDIIALIALYYHANSLHMALLFGAIYASFPTALIAPTLFAGIDCSSIWRWMWAGRTLLIPLYFFVPLLPEVYQPWAVVGIYFCFCSLRSIGVSASFPVLQVITSDKERPAFMGKNVRSFTSAYAVVVLATYLILEIQVFDSDLYNYQLLIALAIVFSIVACAYLFRLPATGALQKTSVGGIIRVGMKAVGDSQCRRVMILTMLNTMIVILCSYTVPFMKEVMVLTSGNVVLMSLIGLVGAIVSTQMLQIIGRRISSWGLILASHALVGAGAVFFALSSPIASATYMLAFVPAVVLIYFGRQAGLAILLKVQTDAIPQRDRYAFSAVFQLAGVVASILAIGYIKVCESWLQGLPVFEGNKYAPIFLTCALLCVLSCIVTLACHGLFRTAADLKMLAPRSLFTFVQVHLLSFRQDARQRMHGLEELMSRDNSLSRSMVLEFLQSGNIILKNSAIRTLFMQQIDESRPLLLEEALNRESCNRDIALTALGLQVPQPDYPPQLLPLLDEPSGAVRASTLKTLLRFGYDIDAEQFSACYRGFSDNMQKFHVIIGLLAARRADLVPHVFEIDREAGDQWLGVIFQSLADMYDRRVEMVELIDAAMESEAKAQAILQELAEKKCDPAKPLDKPWLPVSTTLSRYCSCYLDYLMQNRSLDSEADKSR